MARILIAQTLGTALVPGCFLLAQAAQRLLDAFPTSATAWYLNIAVFAPLQEVRATPSLLATFLDQASVNEWVLVLLLIAVMQIARSRVGVAFLAHLAFAASLLVARAWVFDIQGVIDPGLLFVRDTSGTALVVLLLTATGLACAIGHGSFLIAILGIDRGLPQAFEPERDKVSARQPGWSPAAQWSV